MPTISDATKKEVSLETANLKASLKFVFPFSIMSEADLTKTPETTLPISHEIIAITKAKAISVKKMFKNLGQTVCGGPVKSIFVISCAYVSIGRFSKAEIMLNIKYGMKKVPKLLRYKLNVKEMFSSMDNSRVGFNDADI
jgi:hypothetical protein